MTRSLLIALVLVMVGACGGGGSGGEDAPPDAVGLVDAVSPPDASVPAALERIDWTAVRGAPLAMTAVEVRDAALYAVARDSFAVRDACSEEAVCDYHWYDRDGALLRERPHLAAYTGTQVSPDGTRMAVVDQRARSVCDGATIIEGSLEVVELASGLTLHGTDVRTPFYLDPAWTAFGTWFRYAPLGPTGCSPESGLREGQAPFADAALGPSLYAIAELADGTLVAQDGAYGLVDPRVPGSFVPWSDAIDVMRIAGGWVHGFDGYGDTVQRIRARAPDGTDDTVEVVDVVHHTAVGPSWGRVAMVCTLGPASAATFDHECEVHDLRGERPMLLIRGAGLVRVDAPVAFLGGDRALLVEHVDHTGAYSYERIDLESGARFEVLAPTPVRARLYPIGDGRAAILQHVGGALLVEADRTEVLVEGTVEQVITFPVAGDARPRAQSNLALLVQNLDLDRHRLFALDLDARTLRTLTERLYFTPVLDAPDATDACGQPFTVRTAGAPFEQRTQSATYLHFTEQDVGQAPPYRTFVMPVGGGPPRALAPSSVGVYCHAPLAAPDGSRIGQAIDGGDGTTTIMVGPP